MISFWLTSVLLSLVGYLFYRIWIKEKASFWQQKGFLYFIVVGSLISPAFWGTSSFPAKESAKEAPKPVMFGQIEHQALAQHCKCENPNYAHRFHYQANALLNTAIYYQDWLIKMLCIAIGVVGAFFIGQLLFLARLVNQSRAEVRLSNGQEITFLYPGSHLGAGAFWLGKPYIIWQKRLDRLSHQERAAILAHELSHIHQQNTLEQFLLRILHCFWVLNPIFYLLKKDLALLSECIADQAATQTNISQVDYAKLLVALKQPQPYSQVASFAKSMLRLRIERLFADWPSLKAPTYILVITILASTQFLLTPSLLAEIGHSVSQLETYVTIHGQIDPDIEDAYYCVDCNSMCQPGDFTSYPNPTLKLPSDSLPFIQN